MNIILKVENLTPGNSKCKLLTDDDLSAEIGLKIKVSEELAYYLPFTSWCTSTTYYITAYNGHFFSYCFIIYAQSNSVDLCEHNMYVFWGSLGNLQD